MRILIPLLLAFSATTQAQIPFNTTPPPTPCTVGQQYVWLNASDNRRMLFVCDSSGWQQQGNVGDVTAESLAGTEPGEGSDLVGFKGLVPGAVARRVADKLHETLSLADAGCVTGATDQSTCINSALATMGAMGYSVVEAPAGLLTVTKQIHVPKDMTLRGRGRPNYTTYGTVVRADSSFPAPVYSSITVGKPTTVHCIDACGINNEDVVFLMGLTGPLSVLNELPQVANSAGTGATSFTIPFDSTGLEVSGTPEIGYPMAVYGYFPQEGTCTAFRSRIEDIAFDGQGYANSIWANQCGQENAGVFRSLAVNFTKRGLVIAGPGTQNSEAFGLEINPSLYGGAATIGLVVRDAVILRRIQSLTIQGGSPSQFSNVAVLLTGSVGGVGVVSDIHIERALIGVQLGEPAQPLTGEPARPLFGVNLTNITGDLSTAGDGMQSVIVVSSGSGNISATHVVRGYATNVLRDDVVGDTCQDSMLTTYWLGYSSPPYRQSSCFGRMNMAGPTTFNAGLTIGQNQYIKLSRYNSTQAGGIWQNLGSLILGKHPDSSANVQVSVRHDGLSDDFAISGTTGVASFGLPPAALSWTAPAGSDAVLNAPPGQEIRLRRNGADVLTSDANGIVVPAGKRIKQERVGQPAQAYSIQMGSGELLIGRDSVATQNIDISLSHDGSTRDLTIKGATGDALFNGPVLADRAVVAKTANYTLTDNDRGVTFTNTGAGGAITLTTYATTARRWNRFCVDVAQNFIIAVPSGTVIQAPGVTSVSGGSLSSNQVGACAELQAVSGAKVFAILSGNWTVN